MPIEIRELIIKTHIHSGTAPEAGIDPETLGQLKQRVKNEVLRDLRREMKQQKGR